MRPTARSGSSAPASRDTAHTVPSAAMRVVDQVPAKPPPEPIATVKALRTSSDVRSYALKHWRKLLPELLVAQARVGRCHDDEQLLQVDLAQSRPVRRLLLLPLASGEPRLVRGMLPRVRELGRRRDTWAGLVVPFMASEGVKVCRRAGVGFCYNSPLDPHIWCL